MVFPYPEDTGNSREMLPSHFGGFARKVREK